VPCTEPGVRAGVPRVLGEEGLDTGHGLLHRGGVAGDHVVDAQQPAGAPVEALIVAVQDGAGCVAPRAVVEQEPVVPVAADVADLRHHGGIAGVGRPVAHGDRRGEGLEVVAVARVHEAALLGDALAGGLLVPGAAARGGLRPEPELPSGGWPISEERAKAHPPRIGPLSPEEKRRARLPEPRPPGYRCAGRIAWAWTGLRSSAQPGTFALHLARTTGTMSATSTRA
jgi:hypothetical protein